MKKRITMHLKFMKQLLVSYESNFFKEKIAQRLICFIPGIIHLVRTQNFPKNFAYILNG